MPGYELIGAEERQAINDIFDKSGGVFFAHGFDGLRNGIYKVREFERAISEAFGMPYVQAVSSGTAALKVALQALGVGPGDEVITQAFTFIATAEAIRATGAQPVIVDIDDTLNMDPRALEGAITSRTKVIIPVHMMGEAADMDPILAVAAKHGLKVLEDVAQGMGASYKGRLAGTIGDIGSFSTDAGKTLCTGEGGLVAMRSEELYGLARGFHDHGHEYSKTMGRGAEGAVCAGFNYRMTEMQGALGIVQLKKLDFILSSQRANKAALMEHLKQMPVAFRRSPDPTGDLADTIAFFLPDRERAAAFVAAMRAKGVGTKNLPDAIRWHFAKHWEHLFQGHPLYEGHCDAVWAASADLLERSVAIAVNVKMDAAQIDHIGTTLVGIAKEVL